MSPWRKRSLRLQSNNVGKNQSKSRVGWSLGPLKTAQIDFISTSSHFCYPNLLGCVENHSIINTLTNICTTKVYHALISPPQDTAIHFILEMISNEVVSWNCPFQIQVQFRCFSWNHAEIKALILNLMIQIRKFSLSQLSCRRNSCLHENAPDLVLSNPIVFFLAITTFNCNRLLRSIPFWFFLTKSLTKSAILGYLAISYYWYEDEQCY